MGVRNMRLLAGVFLMGHCCAKAPWATRKRTHDLPTISKKTTPNGTIRPTPFVSASIPGSLAFASVRGGSCSMLESIDDILSKENISTLFASAIIADGLLLAFAPDVAFDLLGGSIEKYSLGGLVAEIIGSVTIGTAITAATMMSQTSTSLARAVGLGLVPRVFVGIKNLLTGNLARVGFELKTKRIAGKIAILGVVVSSLLLEKGKTEATLKIIAGIETLVGLCITIFPEKLTKTADIDLSMEGK
jgi:hypothetical protein